VGRDAGRDGMVEWEFDLAYTMEPVGGVRRFLELWISFKAFCCLVILDWQTFYYALLVSYR